MLREAGARPDFHTDRQGFLAAALREINVRRAKQKQEPLDALPKGYPGGYSRCVLGRALGHDGASRVIAEERLSVGAAARMNADAQPTILTELESRFELRQIPELIDSRYANPFAIA